MKENYFKELIIKYQQGTCNEEEKAIVENWYLQYAKKQQDRLPEENFELVEAEIWDRIKEKRRRTSIFTVWYKIAAAAIIILFLGIAAYQYRSKPDGNQLLFADVKPGGIKAELKMANGARVSLTESQNGRSIDYPAGSSAEKNTYNTIATPKGGQYHFILPDGSQVWLNAYSSLSYPVEFTGSERKVILKGEAYFEISHNKHKPFRLQTEFQQVEVLGTNFNVSSYNDEATSRITLLTGKIKVSENNTSHALLLKPGQELEVSATGKVIKEINSEDAIDWKLGFFKFQNENIKSIMLKVGRWYNVDIAYDGNIPAQGLQGSISRSQNLSKVLELLQATGLVKFRVEERKIIVSSAAP